ncbi:hypothetical protein GF340_06210, partial [Candidatus Peregrinibacteria bacterium]|nr:hypothetical protein [Candidatus Peregrinibacteria bacterium]
MKNKKTFINDSRFIFMADPGAPSSRPEDIASQAKAEIAEQPEDIKEAIAKGIDIDAAVAKNKADIDAIESTAREKLAPDIDAPDAITDRNFKYQ